MGDLAEFLLARIAEDEAAALEANWRFSVPNEAPESVAAHIARHDPARVLAKCAADRRIVRNYQAWAATPGDNASQGAGALRWVLQALALPYADHPDFRSEWRA